MVNFSTVSDINETFCDKQMFGHNNLATDKCYKMIEHFTTFVHALLHSYYIATA